MNARTGYERHVLCGILAATAGSRALPGLLRAFAHDLRDDQDSLTATLTDFARQDHVYARDIILPWATGPAPDLRTTALWLLGYVHEPGCVVTLRVSAVDRSRCRQAPGGAAWWRRKAAAKAKGDV